MINLNVQVITKLAYTNAISKFQMGEDGDRCSFGVYNRHRKGTENKSGRRPWNAKYAVTEIFS